MGTGMTPFSPHRVWPLHLYQAEFWCVIPAPDPPAPQNPTGPATKWGKAFYQPGAGSAGLGVGSAQPARCRGTERRILLETSGPPMGA